jgi:spoIIIJ-associated protein
MIKSIEVSGKDEDEAIEIALGQLGLSRDDVSVEIIERAKKGLLGIKSSPAKVKVIYEEKDNRANSVEKFLSGLLERMDIDAEMEVSDDTAAINVVLKGSSPGELIGRRGETLDAIQHLTNYVVNRGSEDRIRVNIDAENYRERRNETLEKLATRTAGKVLKYRRNMTLEPMNAYERHVIHSALQDHDNINTYSVGTEPNRRIVVAYGTGSESSNRGERRTPRTAVNATPKSLESTTPEETTPTRSNPGQPFREWS